ncbi:MAG: helix-turn-helix domain-containing protein [Bacilli bacterium]|nr:helix-turn-helix domain-containing protein [Bacilli bacterium]
MDRKEVGLRIKALRKARGLSQSELARRMGYKDHSTLAKVETGVNDITIETLYRYAEELGVEASHILGEDSVAFDGDKTIYRLDGAMLPTFPVIYDCAIREISMSGRNLFFVFESDINKRESIKDTYPTAKSLKVRYRLNDEAKIMVAKGKELHPISLEELNKLCAKGLTYLYENVGYKDLILQLWCGSIVVVELPVTEVEYQWIQ